MANGIDGCGCKRMSSTSEIIQKLWSLPGAVLRDGGIGLPPVYAPELTYLLFLKGSPKKTGAEGTPGGIALARPCRPGAGEGQYSAIGRCSRILARCAERVCSAGYLLSQLPCFKHNTSLQLVVDRINAMDWYSTHRDGFGDIYEGLLEKNSVEAKAGAGQYFTPRALIDSIVSLVKPKANEIVQDPAAGTGGFLVSADRCARIASKRPPPRNCPEGAGNSRVPWRI